MASCGRTAPRAIRAGKSKRNRRFLEAPAGDDRSTATPLMVEMSPGRDYGEAAPANHRRAARVLVPPRPVRLAPAPDHARPLGRGARAHARPRLAALRPRLLPPRVRPLQRVRPHPRPHGVVPPLEEPAASAPGRVGAPRRHRAAPHRRRAPRPLPPLALVPGERPRLVPGQYRSGVVLPELRVPPPRRARDRLLRRALRQGAEARRRGHLRRDAERVERGLFLL